MIAPEVTGALFQWLVSTTWQVALAVVVALAIARLLDSRLTVRWRYAIWMALAVRLVVPFVPEVTGGTVQPSFTQSAQTPLRSAHPSLPPSGGPLPRVGSTRDDDTPATATTRTAHAPAPRHASSLSPAALAPPGPPTVTRALPDWPEIAVVAWLAGVALLLARWTMVEWTFRRRLRRDASWVTDTAALDLLEECRKASGLGREVALLKTDLVTAPAVFGWLRPRLLLPARDVARLDHRDLTHIFMHELTHVRRHDVAMNAALHLARVAHWFNPLAGVALRRLRAAREAVRDADALRRLDSIEPVAYARTLIKLMERPDVARPLTTVGLLDGDDDSRRRILMLANFDHRPRHGAVLGATALGLIGWLTFTSASTPDAFGQRPSGAKRPGLAVIGVERQSEAPAWREALSASLDTNTVTAAFENAPFDVVCAFLSKESGIPIVAMPELAYDTGIEVSVKLKPMSVRQVLDVLKRMVEEVDYVLHREVVLVGVRGELPVAMDLRFYDVGPILSRFSGADEDDLIEELMDIVRVFTEDRRYSPFDEAGAAIDRFNRLLVVHQTDEVHGRVHKLLNRILNDGNEPGESDPAPDESVRTRLQARVAVAFENAPLVDIADFVQTVTDVPVIVPDDLSYEELTLNLPEVPMSTVLELAADFVDCQVAIDGPVVRFGEYAGPPKLEFYEISDLSTKTDDAAEEIIDMIQEFIAPGSWDHDPMNTIFLWRDRLLVRQQPGVHAGIGQILSSLRRALR